MLLRCSEDVAPLPWNPRNLIWSWKMELPEAEGQHIVKTERTRMPLLLKVRVKYKSL